MTALLHLTRLIACRTRVAKERGAVASEYALIASLIAVAVITGITAYGLTLGNRFDLIVSSIP